jgi:hypothetical protein
MPDGLRIEEGRAVMATRDEMWIRARREALHLALAAVSGNKRADLLMLRGSALMPGWYPAAAREPGDLDFVVLAQNWEAADRRTDVLFAQLARDAERLSAGTEHVRFDAAGAESGDIQAYDGVPGRSLLLPWRAEGFDRAWVRLDFAFGERIHVEPERSERALSPGWRAVPVLTASKELSLAWKIVWLLTDACAQGKDLYDAVLLAEDTPLSQRVLRDALVAADERYRDQPVALSDLADLDVEAEWEYFQVEHPSVKGSADEWLRRLCVALEPTFAAPDGGLATFYESEGPWLDSLTSKFAALTDDRGEELQQLLLEHGIELATAVVITRELVGRERMSVAEAVRVVLAAPGRADEGARYGQG